MITARIAILEEPRRLIFKLEKLDPENLSEGQVLCQTLVTAISPGTEVAAYRGAPPLRPGVIYPRLVGYCNVARVLRCAPGIDDIRVGDRILSFSSHRSHFLIQRKDVIARLPETIRNEDAACAYLFHLGYSALLSAEVRLGSTVVVLGLGVLGLGSVAMAALAGARIFAISNHAASRDRAVSMGASACFDRSRLPELMDGLGQNRAQVVVTTSNDWEDWRIALACAGNRGCIAVLGFPGREQTQIPFNPLESAHFYDRQLRIIAVGRSPERADGRGFLPFNERENMQRILDWICDGRLKPAMLLSGEIDPGALAEAYEQLLRREGSPLTYLLRWAA
jgi:threonine dehydrogenase-like Zn-dependent dehydrogenase